MQPDDPLGDPPLKGVAFGDDGVPIHDDEVFYASFAAWLAGEAFSTLLVYR
ncbi:MAG: hypothetical protein R3A51_12020 [Nannocystaceae bacterium]|nr:hypothetical protein [Myxococcales bacterium]